MTADAQDSLFGAADLGLALPGMDSCAACGNPGQLIANHCERCRLAGHRAQTMDLGAVDPIACAFPAREAWCCPSCAQPCPSEPAARAHCAPAPEPEPDPPVPAPAAPPLDQWESEPADIPQPADWRTSITWPALPGQDTKWRGLAPEVTPGHAVTVQDRDTRDDDDLDLGDLHRRGACSCGWTGPARLNEATAARDAYDHAAPGWRERTPVDKPPYEPTKKQQASFSALVAHVLDGLPPWYPIRARLCTERNGTRGVLPHDARYDGRTVLCACDCHDLDDERTYEEPGHVCHPRTNAPPTDPTDYTPPSLFG